MASIVALAFLGPDWKSRTSHMRTDATRSIPFNPIYFQNDKSISCYHSNFRMPYLDYWCSLDVTGSFEREILMEDLHGDERLVECLLEERRKRRVEIAECLARLERPI